MSRLGDFLRTLEPAMILTYLVFFCACVPRSVAQMLPDLRKNERAVSDVSKFSLNGSWDFALGLGESQLSELSDFWKPNFHSTRLRPIVVPANWSMLGFETPRYGRLPDGDVSEGFYVRRFRVPLPMHHQRVILHFGGVWDSAEVWLNGRPLGRHDSGFTSFSYDVSGALLFDQENVLAVRVRQQNHDVQLDINDDWSLPGIYREVSLESMPADRWIDRVDVQTVLDNQFRDADLKVRVLVGDGRPRDVTAAPYTLVLTLLDAAEHVVETTRRSIPGHTGTDRVSDVVLHVPSPLLWNAETPNLYTLKVDLNEGETVTHTRIRLIGFREVSTAGGVLRVNGQSIKLRGVDRHDESELGGRATTPADWTRDLNMMKDANINFVRTSHYPPAEGFLDLCDRMGMYVEDEVPMGYGGDKANDPSYLGGVMLRASETVERDLNHPAIIVWSIGNEDPLTAIHLAALRTVKALDPSRPVLMPWRAEEFLPPEVDILAPHYYTAARFDELASHASRPIIATEYSHAYGTEGFGGLEDRWRALTRHPAGAGGAIWMWADQGLRPKGSEPLLNLDGFDGIVSYDREPQRDYWETRAVYAQVYPAVDFMDVPLGASSVRIPIQNDFDFTDLAEIEARWRLMQDDQELAHGAERLAGVPHSLSSLTIPISSIPSSSMIPVAPAAAYYVLLSFVRGGKEITMRSVELQPTTREVSKVALSTRPAIEKSGAGLTVVAGDVRYTFDPSSGRLMSGRSARGLFLGRLDLSLWRPMNANDKLVQPKGDIGPFPDLNVYRTEVQNWHVFETAGSVSIDVEAKHMVDADNMVLAAYHYVIAGDGSLSVHYTVRPHVHQRYLPFVGIALHPPTLLSHARWLGRGPLDSFPNEQTATNFGVWSLERKDGTVESTKASRWTELTAGDGSGLRVEGSPYVRFSANDFTALATVAGRPSKGRLPEHADQLLSTEGDAIFTGELRLTPVLPSEAR